VFEVPLQVHSILEDFFAKNPFYKRVPAYNTVIGMYEKSKKMATAAAKKGNFIYLFISFLGSCFKTCSFILAAISAQNLRPEKKSKFKTVNVSLLFFYFLNLFENILVFFFFFFFRANELVSQKRPSIPEMTSPSFWTTQPAGHKIPALIVQAAPDIIKRCALRTLLRRRPTASTTTSRYVSASLIFFCLCSFHLCLF
jgi:hypothetical protein